MNHDIPIALEAPRPLKPRRPLPSPSNSRSSTPNHTALPEVPVAPLSFYGKSAPAAAQQPTDPPPLPTRPSKNPGSSHTTYLPPAVTTVKPIIDSTGDELMDYREPELVSVDTLTSDSQMDMVDLDDDDHDPDLWKHRGRGWGRNGGKRGSREWKTPNYSTSQWQTKSTDNNLWDNDKPMNDSSWDPNHVTDMGNTGWDDNINNMSSWNSWSVGMKGVNISNREDKEEDRWWDSSLHGIRTRPGPGTLPPAMVDLLHDSDHSLVSVSVTPPDIKPPETAAPLPQSSAGDSFPPTNPTLTILTPDEVRYAVPHPNAYYCPTENAWVILQWKSSPMLPPLAESFKQKGHRPLPDPQRRSSTSCSSSADVDWRDNNTHHFHHYPKSVSSLDITPPFKGAPWLKDENGQVKKNRRGMTIIDDHLDDATRDMSSSDKEEDEEGLLLDLFVCCQCTLHCLVSGPIPGVIPHRLFDSFIRDRHENPSLGKSATDGVYTGVETLIKIAENRLWKLENRSLPVGRPNFQKKIAWNPISQQVFDVLGFKCMIRGVPTPFKPTPMEEESILNPPITDDSPKGRINRAKLLRAWLELNAYNTVYRRSREALLSDHKPMPQWVKTASVREEYQEALGAHPDQIPRGGAPDTLLSANYLKESFRALGLTVNTYTPELLAFAYLAQCRCNPQETPTYYTHLNRISHTLAADLNLSVDLQEFLVSESSKHRWSEDDHERAVVTLGFGKDGPLNLEFESDIPDEFIMNAWKECLKKAWRDPERSSEMQREANDAFRILAESRRSKMLFEAWEDARYRTMTPQKAYETLDLPQDIDDGMLITIYGMRVDDMPSQANKMKEALSVIAEVRESERLRQYLLTGLDPGEIIIPIRADLPRGLNQLGNTCYLNSLLQYFYTIKELREAVAPLGHADLKAIDNEKFSDDDLKRHRVGGRLVTRREIHRSKQFISQLAELFWQMEHCETAAITPTIELAKLALVTSKDEEEDEVDKTGTDSSNDTDATLVDDGVPRVTISSPPQSPSVLGKRPRNGEITMDVDSVSESLAETSASSSSKANKMDVDTKRPNLPQRKSTAVGGMMFGKQHDVAECMDNCMFQIETALLKVGGSEDDDKTSVVKRLFYGRMRQRIAVPSEDSRAPPTVHEKKDAFAHLPVNVGDEGVDIYDGLSGYFDDNMEYESKKARMEVSLIDLPPLLQIQLQRVQFNRETFQPYKSQAYVKFGETIYMDRFLDSADPPKKARSKAIQAELTSYRERIRALTQGNAGPIEDSLGHTLDFLSKQDSLELEGIDEDLIASMNNEQEVLKADLLELRKRVIMLKEELESIWKTGTEAAYELTSVFIHRGSSPSWGHYFFYSRHLPDQPDAWFKYNDSEVSSVSKDEVMADTTGSTANPYLLVYARKGSEVIENPKRFDIAALEDP